MKKVIVVALSVMVVVFFAAASFAADMSGSTSGSTGMSGSSSGATDMSGSRAAGSISSSSMTSNQVFKASDLIGASVKNMQGQDLGRVSDLAISPQGNVFAVISHGGALGVGSKLIPVPINALQIDQSGRTARLDISKSKLDSAPSFTSNNWPDMSNRQWTEDTYKYYGVSPSFQGGTTAPTFQGGQQGGTSTMPQRDMEEQPSSGRHGGSSY